MDRIDGALDRMEGAGDRIPALVMTSSCSALEMSSSTKDTTLDLASFRNSSFEQLSACSLDEILSALTTANAITSWDAAKYISLHRERNNGKQTHLSTLRKLVKNMELPFYKTPQILGEGLERREYKGVLPTCVPGCSKCCKGERGSVNGVHLDKKDVKRGSTRLPILERTSSKAYLSSGKELSRCYVAFVPLDKEGVCQVLTQGKGSGEKFVVPEDVWTTVANQYKKKGDSFPPAYPQEGFEGRVCSAYTERPRCCRYFGCSIAQYYLPRLIAEEGNSVMLELLSLPNLEERFSTIEKHWKRTGPSTTEKLRYLRQIRVL